MRSTQGHIYHHAAQLLKIVAVFGFLLLLEGCVQFKTASLYDGEMDVPPIPRPERINLAVEPIIFKEQKGDVWGVDEKDECKDVTWSTEVVHEGNRSIKLVWDRGAEGCTWAGIGIGWDGYAGKDLSAIMDHAAISMWVRTVEGKSFGLPFVLTLEDYSGGMGFCYTSNKYFERTTLDEEWQNIIVPLKDFDLETENLDVTNIKQLQIELQQSGAFYLDNMELIYYTAPPQEPWMEEEELPDPLDFPITLFDDGFINNHGWGLITDDCQSFSLSKEEQAEGTTSIHAVWNATDEACKLVSIGVSWNKWFPTDIKPALENGAIQFQIKMVSSPAGEDISIKVGFEDYDRQRTFATLQNAYSATGAYTPVWTKVTVPFSNLPATVDFTNIKHLQFDFEGVGECYIDDIKLVEMLP